MTPGNWGWHDPSIVPAGYVSEFSFLTFAATPEKPYSLFLWELKTPCTSSFWEHDEYSLKIYNRDDPTEFYNSTNRNTSYQFAPPYGTISQTEFWNGNFPVYLASTIPQNYLTTMNFYACYLDSEVATSTPTATPEPTATITPTPTPTPNPADAQKSCSFGDATKIDGYNYTFSVSPGTTDAHYHFYAIGNVSVTITDPNLTTKTYTFILPFWREVVLDILNPASGTWTVEYNGIALYGNGATIDLCTTVYPTPTPTPDAGTPTAPPTTPTPTPTTEPTIEPPPTQNIPTPTPVIWPTASFATPAPAPTPAGCPQDDPFCGAYFTPVDGTIAEFSLDYDATYCVTFLPPIEIVNYGGLTICLDTYRITATFFDVDLPIVMFFTLFTLLLIYIIVRG